MADNQFDYIVVGSGAGGGPVAANLARGGFHVLLLEAGEDHGDSYEYRVPAFHPHASEDERMRWDFFVKHYSDPGKNQRAWDPKYCDGPVRGVLYPRAATLGGCTAHNALITMVAYDADWERIARITGDDSWKAENMQQFFARIDQCGYRGRPRSLHPRINRSRHGFDGWLPTELPAFAQSGDFFDVLVRIVAALFDDQMLAPNANPVAVLSEFYRDDPLRLAELLSQIGSGNLQGALQEAISEATDPNDWRTVQRQREGLFKIPLATRGGVRYGTRELLSEAARECPNLEIRTGSLATRILIDGGRAIGVDYLQKPKLYRADRDAHTFPAPDATQHTATAKREVILSAGVFNTPQLLMLSGVGPKTHLESVGVDCLVNLPGVGRNLQDRYEIALVSEIDSSSAQLLGDCRLGPPRDGEQPDDCLVQWNDSKTGIYATNGALVGVIRRSKPDRPRPDLFLMGLLSDFKGYEVGYAERLRPAFTWAILKAYTNNTAGTVQLRSKDPLESPEVNFRYFEEGNDHDGEDLESVVEGIKFARQINARFAEQGISLCETLPGGDIDTDEEIGEYVRREAWGHHGCGTCRIGRKDDPDAVIGSDFRVHGVTNLRIVDASVFPRIPGFFIAAPIYMIAEKASKIILSG